MSSSIVFNDDYSDESDDEEDVNTVLTDEITNAKLTLKIPTVYKNIRNSFLALKIC
jgi:hypothetical protein